MYRKNKNRPREVSSIVVLLLGVAALLLGVALPAIAATETDESGFALLLQSSPVNGGSIVPGNGVHRMQIGQSVPLTAVPQRGYRFLYWIGDVGQIDRTRTTVRMDSPKLVVAVFEREQFEDLLGSGIVSGSATGGLHQSANPITGSGGVSPPGPEPEPTPEEPIPEPSSVMLLGLGVIAIRKMRK